MATLIDNRQLICHDYLPEVLANSNIQTDAVLRAIDNELTPIFKMSYNSSLSPTGYVVTIGSNSLQNPQSLQNRVNIPLAGAELPFTSGTITFPTSNGGNITLSNGASVAVSMASGYYTKVLVGITSSSAIVVTLGTAGTSIANATLPVEPVNSESLGYIVIQNLSGTIQPVTNASIYTFNAHKYLPLGNVVGTTDTQNLTNKTLTSVIINGVSSNILPTTAGLYNLGSPSFTWNDLYTENLNVNTGSIESMSSTLNIGTASSVTTMVNIATSSSTQVVNIGTGGALKTINIGAPGDVVNIQGTLNVVNTVNTSVTSNHIDLNVGGVQGSASLGLGSGIFIDEESTTTNTLTLAEVINSATQIHFHVSSMAQAVAATDTIRITGAGAYNGTYSVISVSVNDVYCNNPNALTLSQGSILTGTMYVVEAIAGLTYSYESAPNGGGVSTGVSTTWSFYNGLPLNKVGNLNFLTGSQWSLGETASNVFTLAINSSSQSGSFVPAYDNQYALGTNSLRWASVNAASIVNSGPIVESSLITTTSSTYTVLATDAYVFVDSTGGSKSVLLQASGSLITGRKLTITDQLGVSSINAITVTAGSGTTLNGSSSFTINSNYQSVTLIYLAATTNWYII